MTAILRLSSTKASALIDRSYRAIAPRCFSTLGSSDSESKCGGAGAGNVEDKILPSALNGNELFRYCKSPRTASIIGAPMTYGQPFIGTVSRKAAVLLWRLL